MKIIPELSSNTLLICYTENSSVLLLTDSSKFGDHSVFCLVTDGLFEPTISRGTHSFRKYCIDGLFEPTLSRGTNSSCKY